MIYSSAQAQKALGFNDKPVRLITYPIAGLLIPLVFFPQVFEANFVFIAITMTISLMYTMIYWEGNRQIIIFHRLKFSLFNEVWKRLFFQMLWVTVYTLTVSIIAHFFFHSLPPPPNEGPFEPLTLGEDIKIGLVNTYISILFYECAYFFQRWKQSVIETERLQLEKVETQLESLKNQVNPHFLFNSLNTLTSLIPNDPDEAVEFVQRLAQVYRYVLDVNATKLIFLEKELSFVRGYLFLLRARHGDRLHVNVDIPEEYDNYQLIPLALQILIENAVKHNVVSSKNPLYVEIFVDEENYLIVTNPILQKKYVSNSTGLGLNNIKSRYALLTHKQWRY